MREKIYPDIVIVKQMEVGKTLNQLFIKIAYLQRFKQYSVSAVTGIS